MKSSVLKKPINKFFFFFCLKNEKIFDILLITLSSRHKSSMNIKYRFLLHLQNNKNNFCSLILFFLYEIEFKLLF